MALTFIPKKFPSIIFINDLEDYGVLFNPLTAETIGLNDAGKLIWESMNGCLSVKGLSEVLQSVFPVDADTADRDTLKLISKLHRRMFIEVPGMDGKHPETVR